jgi:thiazole synthase
MEDDVTEDQLTLYGQRFSSRLLLGSARYQSPDQMRDAISAADPALVTVSLRREASVTKDAGQTFWSAS